MTSPIGKLSDDVRIYFRYTTIAKLNVQTMKNNEKLITRITC